MANAPLPPCNIEAEEYVLGACMLSPRAIEAVADVVVPSDFYRASHGVVYQAVRDMYAAGQAVDAITVADRLAELGQLEKVGGKKRIRELATLVPATSNAAHHAAIVREMAVLRGLVSVGDQVARLGWDRPGPAAELLGQAEGLVFELSQQRRRGDFVSAAEIAHESFSRLEQLAARKGTVGISTGYVALDEVTSGLHPGNLVVIGGRPSMGKGLGLEASVLTPTGWRRNGDLQVGDPVIGGDGREDVVTGVHDRGEMGFYRVTFSDGATVDCSGDHLWLTRTRLERRRGAPGTLRDTTEIAATLKRMDTPNALNHSIPWVAPVRFAPGPPLPLDPYWLGLYLGDGSSSGSVILSNPEPDIQEAFVAALPAGDDSTLASTRGRCDVVRVRRLVANRRQSESLMALRALGLARLTSAEKFIPAPYLLARFEDRVALLQGLCDTDGFVVAPVGYGVEISTASPQLRDGILFLVRSLGGRATSTKRAAHYIKDGERHRAKDAHRIVLTFPQGNVIPVRSKKNYARWRGGANQKGRERMIESIKPTGRAECRCITVGRGLYVTDGFVVTHNSALALGVCAHNVLRSDPVPTALFTMEMSRQEVFGRFYSAEGLVESDRIMTPSRMRSDDWEKVAGISGRLAAAPLYIEDTGGGASMVEVRSKARRLKLREPDLGLIVIDYLQLMTSDDGRRWEGRQNEISQISRALKVLAGELALPIVAVSQLSRAVEARHDKRPILSDLRDSGAVEQDADVVMLVYREEYYFPEDEVNAGIAEVNIAKHRNGPTGMRKLAFVKRFSRFSDMPLPGMTGL